MYFLAALGNGIGRLVTYRRVTFSGGVILFISLMLTAFAPNIYVVIVVLGLGSGKQIEGEIYPKNNNWP